MKAGMLAAVSAAAAGAAAGETVDVAYLKANHPDLAAALIAEGKAEAKAETVKVAQSASAKCDKPETKAGEPAVAANGCGNATLTAVFFVWIVAVIFFAAFEVLKYFQYHNLPPNTCKP
jgi:hypothetical protein